MIQCLGLDIINEFYKSKFGKFIRYYLTSKGIYTEVDLQTSTIKELIDDTWSYLCKRLQCRFLLGQDVYEFYNDGDNESIEKRLITIYKVTSF